MNGLSLGIRTDPATGLPTAHVMAGEISTDQLSRINAFVHKNFERLVSYSSGQVVAIRYDPASSPQFFQVTCDRDLSSRFPRIRLDSCDKQPAATAPIDQTDAAELNEASLSKKPLNTQDSDWLEDMLEHFEQLFKEHDCGDNTSTLVQLIEDMRTCAKKDRRALSMILLAGYIHMGDLACGNQDSFYGEAAADLQEMYPHPLLNALLSTTQASADAD